MQKEYTIYDGRKGYIPSTQSTEKDMLHQEGRELFEPYHKDTINKKRLKKIVRRIKREKNNVAVDTYLDAIRKAISSKMPDDALYMMNKFSEGVPLDIFQVETLHIALHEAVRLGYDEVVSTLLTWGADPHWRSRNRQIIGTGATPLSEAVKNLNIAMVSLIINHPKFLISDLTAQSVIYAAYMNQNQLLMMILDKYGKMTPTIDTHTIKGKSALMCCIERAFDSGAASLIAKGALESNLNIINLDTLLLKAFSKKMFLTTKMIVEHKKPGQIKEITNIIYAAIQNKQYDLIPVLLRGEPFNSIDLNTVRFEGRTIIEHAIGLEREQGHSETLKLLIPYMKLPTIGSASTPTATGTTATRLTLWQRRQPHVVVGPTSSALKMTIGFTT